jgi:hypothetical protein
MVIRAIIRTSGHANRSRELKWWASSDYALQPSNTRSHCEPNIVVLAAPMWGRADSLEQSAGGAG